MNEYMKKVFKVTLYGLKNNEIFIFLMFVLSLCLMAIWGAVAGTGSDATLMIPTCLGVLLPMAMLGYVHSRSECDFYHSMPIKRSQYFLGYTISCFIAFLAVYIPVNLIYIAVGSYFMVNFFAALAVFFVTFSVTVLAIMLSGSVLSTLITLLILNAVIYETALLILSVAQVDTQVYLDVFNTALTILSPFSALDTFYSNDPDVIAMALQLLMAAVNLCAAFFLHRYRKNESTAAVAFPKTRYVIQYMAMFMVALFISSRDSLMYIIIGDGRGRSFSRFLEYYVDRPSFFPYTFLAIIVTFIITNMVFENTPRGALKRIRHLFIFALSYAAFFIFIVGGVLYPNMPYTFVPFESDLVLVSVYKYEEQGRVKLDTEQDEYYYNGGYFPEPAVMTRTDSEEYPAQEDAVPKETSSGPTSAAAAEFTSVETIIADTEPPITAEPSDSYFQNIMYKEEGKWFKYRDDEYEYYLRQTDTTVYAVTDKSYISYLRDRVRKTDRPNNYILGHNEVIADNIVYTGEIEWDDIYEIVNSGVYICKLQFFKLNESTLNRYIDLVNQDIDNIGSFVPESRYTISTYVDSEEAMEEFKAHTAYRAVNPDTSTAIVPLYFNY
ncbi:MAG: hypothetical protein NC394_04480 [Bacteroides sp.]|nr:hypothetical protein [Bacteroides sp.]